MATRRALTAETLQLLANNLGGMLIGLVGTILITRALGPEARGVYAWILTISSLAVWFALLAQYNIVRKLGAERAGESHWPTHLGSLVTLNVVGSVLAVPLLLWALTQPLGLSHTKLLLLSACSIPFMTASVVLSAFVHLRRRTAATLLSTFIPRLAGVGLVVLAWRLGELTLGMAVFLNTFLAIVGVLALHAWLRVPLRTWRLDSALLKQASRFLGAGWVAGLALFAMPKVPMLLLPLHARLEDIGYFSLATTLLDISLMVPAAATSVLVSYFARNGGKGHGKRQALYALAALVGVMAVFGYVLAPCLLPLLFGADFAAAVPLFRLLLLALLLQAPQAVLAGVATAAGHNRAVLWPPLAGLATALAFSLVLLPVMGVAGACWAIIAGYAVQLVVLVLLGHPRA